MSDELKNCPHCGNNDYLIVKRVEGENVSPDNFQVVCSWLLGGCGASGGVRRTEAEAIAAWNQRANDAQEQCVDNAQADSRERLEADILSHYKTPEEKLATVREWLDRQAAITAKQLTSQSVAPETAETAETDVAKEHMRDFDADSKERLRADVYEGFSAVDLPEQIRDVLRSRVHTWLDRQAAITHAEVFEDGEYDCRTCDAKRELQERVDSLTAECDNWANCYDMAVKREQSLLSKIDELTAEVEAQRKRANDAERGVLSEEWYVCRDRYEDDIAELTAERDEQRKRKATAEQKLNALLNRLKEQRVGIMWNDGISDWHVSLPIEEFAKVKTERDELRERLDRLAAEFDDDDWNTLADGKEPPDYPMAQFQPKNGGDRERLESEVTATVGNLVKYCGAHPALFEKAKLWLDCQAAITEREVVKQREKQSAALVNHVNAYKTRIDKLTTERDELKAEISKYEHDCGLLFDEKNKLTADVKKWADAANEQRLVAMEQADKVHELTAERDELRRRNAELEAERCDRTFDIGRHYDKAKERVAELEAELARKQHICDVQCESFRKMERELAEAKAADYTAMKDEIEKLEKRVAGLEAEKRDLCMKIYGAPF